MQRLRNGTGLALLGLLLVTLSGCFGGDIAKFVEQAQHDDATVCVSITHPYGNIQFARSNVHDGEASCLGGLLSVKDGAAVPQRIGVPLVVVPHVTLGAPVLVAP